MNTASRTLDTRKRTSSPAPAGVQRKARLDGPRAVRDSESPGQTVDARVQRESERAFGHNFGDVRIHSEERAGKASSTVAGRVSRGEPAGLSRSVQLNVQDETAQGTAADKPAPPATEEVEGTLWAKGPDGKPLPPSLDDISQGNVGDCYLFAAMSAMVKADPNNIVNMIQDNEDGTYTVTFSGIGWASSATQTVPAKFPVGQHGRTTTRKALWPLIIEAAYAKQKGGIDIIGKGGNPGNAVEEMLNEGPTRFDPRTHTVDYIVGKVATGLQDKAPMTALAPKKEGAGKEKKALAESTAGLIFNHAYAIVDVDAKNNRIKLFNPWGSDHPNGDGWMDVSQFRQFFMEVDINE